jgi:phage repressor protein C with HTH and peptisase S24 domain
MFARAYTATQGLQRDMPSRPRPHAQLSEAQRLGMALRSLRRRHDLSQARAAELANTRQQTWQRYEAGENDALLKAPLVKRLVEALGASVEEFQVEVARFDGMLDARPAPAATGMTERARVYEFPVVGRVRAGPQGTHAYDAGDAETIDLSRFLGEDTRVLRLAGESMVPYAEPGGFVTYNIKIYPRRGQGCVIEMENGDFYIKRYERADADTLHVTELFPEERALTFDLTAVKGIYAVGLRGD